MPQLDHLTVIAPTLAEGVAHVRACLDLDVPFGTRHLYMGTHNHRLRLGDSVYLEIVALDPEGTEPPRRRWFGLDAPERVRADWDAGHRLRGWVARTERLAALTAAHGEVFGRAVPLPDEAPSFAFSLRRDGSLPLDGAAPSLIDHRGDFGDIARIPDLGARLQTFALAHPEPERVAALYRALGVEGAPALEPGPELRYRATIETPAGTKVLT